MAIYDGASEIITVRAVTPLYGFSTDTTRLAITEDVCIEETSEERLHIFNAKDVFIRHIHLYKPQHLLWHKLQFRREEFPLNWGAIQLFGSDAWDPDVHAMTFIQPVAQILRGLHFFKPGRLIAGDTAFFVDRGTLLLSRCSDMAIDFFFVQQYQPHYELKEIELPFLSIFLAHFDAILVKARQYPQIELAVQRYARESSLYGDAVELMISLEALLVPEEEGIAFRLAQRVANLLGSDALARKELFKRIREFYGVRSKIVHGAQFKPKDDFALQHIDALREITRLVILSIMALAADAGLEDLPNTLNEMCFDDDLRRSIQSKSAALLHC